MKKLLVVLLFVVVGCAPKIWYRDNTTQQQFAQDKAECRYQVSLAAPANPFQPMNTMLGQLYSQNELFIQCMNLRGYYTK